MVGIRLEGGKYRVLYVAVERRRVCVMTRLRLKGIVLRALRDAGFLFSSLLEGLEVYYLYM